MIRNDEGYLQIGDSQDKYNYILFPMDVFIYRMPSNKVNNGNNRQMEYHDMSVACIIYDYEQLKRHNVSIRIQFSEIHELEKILRKDEYQHLIKQAFKQI